MRVATWNVNSLKARLPKVVWWLERAQPDVLLMQETKLADGDVPREELSRLGYQLVHHGIWDMDIPCAPILGDLTVNGRTIKAIAQPTKQGWVYVFDRATGEPVWPI